MTNPITITQSGGIKCDNPSCDYIDSTVIYEDAKNWLNKPCPKCLSNLLTEEDYSTLVELHGLTNKTNKDPFIRSLAEAADPKDNIRAKILFDGAGKPILSIVE